MGYILFLVGVLYLAVGGVLSYKSRTSTEPRWATAFSVLIWPILLP